MPHRTAGTTRPSGAGSLVAAAAGLGALAAAAVQAARERKIARRAERRHPPIGRFVTVDGVKVHYAAWGEGPPVVLLHGNGALIEDFLASRLVTALASRYRVVALDRPGFGYTERPRDRLWTAAAQADLVAATLDRLGIERPVVVGHSWGALAAAALAVGHPEAVGGLVLLSGYFYPTARLDVWLLALPALPLLGDAFRYTLEPPLVRASLSRALARIFAPEPVPAHFARFPLGLALRPGSLRAASEDSAFMIPSAAALADRYRDIAVPVEIVTGDGDRIVDPQRQSIRLARDIAGAGLTIVPGAGHMVHYAAPDAIAAAVERVMDEAGREGFAAGSEAMRQGRNRRETRSAAGPD